MKRKEQKQKIPIKKILLATAGTAGMVSMAVFAPNALQVINSFSGGRRRSLWYLTSTIGRMESQGLITFEEREEKKFVRLTEKGKKELMKYRLKEKLLKRKRWDRKWRLIIFDIRESKRGKRDQVRRELANFGFVRLQHSVWVFPYDCEEVMIMLKADFRLGREVLYVKAQSIENDVWLRKVFNLPR